MSYLKPAELEKAMSELEGLNKQTLEYFFDYMKIIMSFGKPHMLTLKGLDYAKNLLERWKNKEELKRDEIMCLGVLGTELIVLLLQKNHELLKEVHKYYEEMLKKYNPDFAYMQHFTQIEMFNRGYIQDNPRLYTFTIIRHSLFPLFFVFMMSSIISSSLSRESFFHSLVSTHVITPYFSHALQSFIILLFLPVFINIWMPLLLMP